MFELRFYHRGKEIIKYNLLDGDITVGRSSENQICLPSHEKSLPPKCLRLSRQRDAIFALDLSGNGFKLNGQKKQRAIVGDRDFIEIGNWTIEFRIYHKLEYSGEEELEAFFQNQRTRTLTLYKSQEKREPPKGYLELEKEGKRYRYIIEKSAIIGSSEACDLQLNDPYVSSKHCRIFESGGKFFLTDLESRNGTWINSVRIFEAELKPGSYFRVGNTKIGFFLSSSEKIFPGYAGIIGDSEPIRKLFNLLDKVAASDITVLILGESGVGKEVVARAIHNLSLRRSSPFIAINCGAITHELFESILFGHEKGAFTGAARQHRGAFEQAGDGTLFLDEVGELPLNQQVKLLRVLETGEFSRLGGTAVVKNRARILAATNRDLSKMVKEGLFREDLFFRLNVFTLRVPPLRFRERDPIHLAEFFLKQFSPSRELSLTIDAVQKILSHHWPGNVRELKNAIRRAVILAEGNSITADDLILDSSELSPEDALNFYGDNTWQSGPFLNPKSREFEKNIIIKALTETNWNVKEAARRLNISRSTLYNKISRYNIPTPRQLAKKMREKDHN